MGAGASFPGYDSLSEEDKATMAAKYQELIDSGKTEEEAIAEIQAAVDASGMPI